jgi:2-aminoethylphosphonate-pyruvate transaminase
MSIAARAEDPTRWATERALLLWVAFANAHLLAEAESDGAAVARPLEVSPYAVFAAMQEAGVDDVRRVGVLADDAAGIAAGRKAGAGAVIGIAEDAMARELLRLAEPDAVVPAATFEALEDERYGSRRELRPRVLLNPGPALTTDRVKRAAAGVDLCHREPEYKALEARVRDRLREVAGVGTEWGVALVSGSGTAADELALVAAVRPERTLLVIRNGVYGDRLQAMAEAHGIATVTIDRAWTEAVEPAAVAAALAGDPSIDAVALVHHETTTGLLNPLAAIAEVCRAADVRLVVDAVSSFGAEPIALAGSGIDLLVASSNKCLHGLPGAAFVLVSPAGAARVAEVPRRSVYLDLAGYLRAAESGSVPFTPAVPAIAALDAALEELAERGLDEHQAAYRERAATLDGLIDRLGLEPLLDPAVRSSSIRSVRLPEGVGFDELHDALRAHGFVVYAGQGRLASEVFRISCMGALEPPVLWGLEARLADVLAGERVSA